MRRIIALPLCVLLTLAACGGASAQDRWPKPKDGWWKALSAGETAIFEMSVSGMRMNMVVTVDEVTDTAVTYSTRTVQSGRSFPMETKTIDVRGGEVPGAVQPAGAKITKGQGSTYQVDGRTFVVTEYTVQVDGKIMHALHAPDLAPIFNGGNVRFTVPGGQGMELRLVSYEKGR